MTADQINAKAYELNNVPAGCMVENAIENSIEAGFERGTPAFEAQVRPDLVRRVLDGEE